MIKPETTPIEPMFDPAKVGASLDAMIPIRADFLRGVSFGETTSLRQGSGLEIDGVRPYVAGDDTRHIDWNATARDPNQWPQIRLHMADITPALWLLTDAPRTKYEANGGYFSEQQLALSAIMSVVRAGNIQGMPSSVIASDDYHVFVGQGPALGQTHVVRVGQELSKLVVPSSPAELVTTQPKRALRRRGRIETSPPIEERRLYLKDTLQRAGHLVTESVVVVVSDFRDSFMPDDEQTGWEQTLRNLVKNGNDILAVELTNPWDFHLPEEVDRALGSDVEFLGDKRGEEIRRRYEQLAQVQQTAITDTFRRLKIGHVQLSADEPKWLTSFRGQMHRITRRVGRAA